MWRQVPCRPEPSSLGRKSSTRYWGPRQRAKSRSLITATVNVPKRFRVLVSVGVLVACGNSATSVGARAPDTAPRIAAIRDEFGRKRFYQTCGEPRPVGAACGLLADTFWNKEKIAQYTEASCPNGELKGECWWQLRLAWYTALIDRYPRGPLKGAPNVVCEGEACPSPWGEELQMLRDHNADVAREEDLAISRVQLDAIEQQKEAELEAARAEQARRERISRALQSIGQPYQPSQSSTPTQPYQPAVPQAVAPNGCSSDYECGVGFVCAKDSLSFRGLCARAVDQNGIPQPRLPNPGSIGPGTGNCQFDTDCTIGFRCIKSSGGLYGNCMK